MNKWFTCKVKYDRYDDNGVFRPVTEAYLVDAVSFTEAEERINKEVLELVDGETQVINITKSRVADLLGEFETADYTFMAKIRFVSVNEDSGAEKKQTQQVLIAADKIDDALEELKKFLQTWLTPVTIVCIQESPIVQVFPYVSEEEAYSEEDINDDLDKAIKVLNNGKRT